MKIGIIQNAAQTADLSANLRTIVQSYRDCIDRGAELVIAHAFALTGAQTKDLTRRISFQNQSLKALGLLALEVNSAPLLIAAYAEPYLDLDDITLLNDGSGAIIESTQQLCPFLLEDGQVNQLEEGELTDILGVKVSMVIGDDYNILEEDGVDLFIRLSTLPWYTSGPEAHEDTRRWDAQINNCPAITLVPLAYAEATYYAGGSCVYNEKGVAIHRLPLFTATQAVVSLKQTTRAMALPLEEEMLRQALIHSLRAHTENHGYTGICLNLDQTNSKLLTLLCVEALGASRVHGISFSNNDFTAEKKLGIKYQSMRSLAAESMLGSQGILKEEAEESYYQRMQAAILNGYAEQEGLMVLSPLNRHQILMGEYTLYAESCAKILPFGKLYERDIYLLSQYLSEERVDYFGVLSEPLRPEIDRILVATQDLNVSGTTLIASEGDEILENDVRFVQRRVKSSAEMALQLPPSLNFKNPDEDNQYPAFHRLND